MYRKRKNRHMIRRHSYWVISIMSLASLVIGALLKAPRNPEDVENQTLFIQCKEWVIEFNGEHAWWAIIGLGFIGAFVSFIDRKWGREESLDKSLKTCISQFKSNIFNNHNNEADQYHRVTLYRHIEKKRNGFTGRLVPYERSGQNTLNRKMIRQFGVNLDNPDASEGIVGKCFAHNSMQCVENLVDVSASSLDEEIKKYAEITFTSVEMVKKSIGLNKIMNRSFWAIPVVVNGTPWGVLIIDSRNTNLPKRPSTIRQSFEYMEIALNTLLK